MTRLPATLAERGIAAEFHAVGDKIHKVPSDPDYHDRMEAALRDLPGVTWHGGRSRREAIDLVARCDIGLSWRDRSLDASLELSTKVLEYGAVEVCRSCSIERRCTRHSSASTIRSSPIDEAEVVDAVELAASDAVVRDLAAERVRGRRVRVRDRRAVATARRTPRPASIPSAPLLARPGRPLRSGSPATTSSSSLASSISSSRMPEIEVRVDEWPRARPHDPEPSESWWTGLTSSSASGAGPNARLVQPSTAARISGSSSGFIGSSCTDPGRRRSAIEESTGSSVSRRLTPQLTASEPAGRRDKVDGDPELGGRHAARPNQSSRVPASTSAWSGSARRANALIWRSTSSRRSAGTTTAVLPVRQDEDALGLRLDLAPAGRARRRPTRDLQRIQTSRAVAGRGRLRQFGPDVGTWLRRIGFILSTSDDESFHLAPAEGMASGAVPVIRSWPVRTRSMSRAGSSMIRWRWPTRS